MHFVSFLPQANTKSRGQKPDFRSGWKEISHFNRTPRPFTANSGPARNFSGLSPGDIFKLFFSSAVWDLLVHETNRYAEQTGSETSWIPTHANEMMAFLALILAMGINKLPQYSMYWSTCEVIRLSFYPSIMSRNRFTSIMRYFHLSDNQLPEPASGCDKLKKVRPLLDVLLQKFRTLYHPGQNLSPDESMLKFKGRLGFYNTCPESRSNGE